MISMISARVTMNHSSNRLTRLAKFLQMPVSQRWNINVDAEFQNVSNEFK